ncbi:MAG: hypothetical protein BYD32DRAFT_88628 [Podila humilis]|nr:MAG: hypothetical protein BYD32DRAFT_88628 [Podila humilis]
MRPNHAYCHLHFFILLARIVVLRPLCGFFPICGIHTKKDEKKIEDHEKEDNQDAEKRGVMFTRGSFEIEPKGAKRKVKEGSKTGIQSYHRQTHSTRSRYERVMAHGPPQCFKFDLIPSQNSLHSRLVFLLSCYNLMMFLLLCSFHF